MRYTIPQAARYQPEFDCPLPDGVCRELIGKRRPQPPVKTLQRPQSAWRSVLHLLAWLAAPVALVALLAAFMTASGWRPTTRGSLKAQRIAQAALDRTAVAMSTPSIATPAAPVVLTPEVRRAQPVPVTVKRATLLRLPTQELGIYKWYAMPAVWGGGSVWARYCGTVGRFSEIPPNPVPGDMWNVTETNAGWIYCTPVGYDHAAWIDP